jgi:hypothetical protein
MKLPFNFGIKLIFRMIFPGAILAAALVPAVHGILQAMGFSIKFEYLFPVEVMLWGWIINVSDMQIYMLFEGRRYWPSPIRNLRIRCQQRRLERLSEVVTAERMGTSVDRRRSLEAGVEYGHYPTDEHGEAYVAQPTRLGNIIESYEAYSNVKYGLDSVFYWYRLWVMLDKDLREEIDSSQAMVDSTVYVCFVLYASAFVMLAYAGIGGAAHLHWSYINRLSAINLPYVPAPGVLCGMAGACFVIGFTVYYLSLPAHAKFGELFKSVFDQYRSKLVFDDVLKAIARIMDVPTLMLRSQQEKNRIVWRYLRWHLIRDDAAHRNLTIEEWEDRRHPSGPAGAP